MELIAGDPAAAERYLREGYEAFRAMGERGYLSSVAGSLAEALVSPTSWAALKAQVLMTKAEVNQLAGARDRAAASLRAALRIYQDRHVAPLIDQVTAALASLTDHPGTKPA